MIATQSRIEPRGVYRSKNLMQPQGTHEGYRYLYAVTTRGHILPKVIVLKPGVDENAAARKMRDYLEREDRPYLQLVEDAPVTVPKPLTRAEREAIYIEEDPVRRMIHQRKKLAAAGQLPPLRRFR